MRYLFGFLLIIIFLGACTSRPVEPTRSSRHAIDTLFQHNIIQLKPEMDSLCKSLSEILYKEAVDSIMAARQLEMNILVE
ncbi:MAG TPA: hypothetical protein VMZ69_03495 [Saprospiraceae bacterium]|nr:hypothetical protein [Saprospiraceae bacterium]